MLTAHSTGAHATARSMADGNHHRQPNQSSCECVTLTDSARSDAVELQHADRVAAPAFVGLLGGYVCENFFAVLLRAWPGGVGVRVVGLEADLVLADLVERAHTVTVPREAAEHAAVVVGRRRLGAQAFRV